jgi:DNA-binding NtrC family response regulator
VRVDSYYRVLVIDDQTRLSCVCASLAEERGLRCEPVPWEAAAQATISRSVFNLIIAVINAPHDRVTAFFDAVEREPAPAPIVAIVPDCDDGLVAMAARVAADFVFAPVRPFELRHRVARMLDERPADLDRTCDRLFDDIAMTRLVGRNAAFVRAIRMLPRFAKADATILITGETGTGKEVCARALHHLSGRRHAPFVPVDCAALPDQLFENELFGHARGAFTDAHRDQKGLVAIANGGTLFLDEIDSVSAVAQGKLLRFLQDQTYRALGSERNDRANVRVIAACNGDLEARVHERTFRSDLFFRLNILRVNLPPLRDRLDDIPLLVRSILDDLRDRQARSKVVSTQALRALAAYGWPGNIRELANVVHRAAIGCDGDTILPEHLDLPADVPSGPLSFRAARALAVATFERAYVADLLRRHAGNVTHAAKEANQDRRALGRVIKKHKIDRNAL